MTERSRSSHAGSKFQESAEGSACRCFNVSTGLPEDAALQRRYEEMRAVGHSESAALARIRCGHETNSGRVA